MYTHTRHVGDKVTPVSVQVMQKTEAGVLEARDISGLSSQWKLINSRGEEVVAWTATGITTTDATTGKINISLASESDNIPAGQHYMYVRVGSGGSWDNVPAIQRDFVIQVYGD